VSIQPEQRKPKAVFNSNKTITNNPSNVLVGNTFSVAPLPQDLFLDQKFHLDAVTAPSCGTGMGGLDPFAAFAHGAFDATFSNQLFSFDDYLTDPTSSS
jgi:hypothetical protein